MEKIITVKARKSTIDAEKTKAHYLGEKKLWISASNFSFRPPLTRGKRIKKQKRRVKQNMERREKQTTESAERKEQKKTTKKRAKQMRIH